MKATQAIVLGAGYAGLLAAVRLANETRSQNVTITLVNASDNFVERMRLHQFATNQPLAPRPLSETLDGTGITLVKGLARQIDTAQHQVIVQVDSYTRRIEYDRMIYALGSTIERDIVPGVRDHAYTLTPMGLRSADELREALPALNAASGRVLVVGGGATGIEAAAEFAEAYPNLHVELVTQGTFGSFLNDKIAAYMRQALHRLDVTIIDHTTITQVRAGEALTASGQTIGYEICLWAGGFTAPTLAREAGIAVNEKGQILIDPFMRSISHPDIYAVGDAAHPVQDPSVPVRMSAFASFIMGAHGADCLAAELSNKTPRPLSFAYLGQGIALGRHDAIGLNNFPDDKPHAPYFTHRLGYEGREFFVSLLAELPNIEKRLPGSVFWLGKGRYKAQQRRMRRRVTAQSW